MKVIGKLALAVLVTSFFHSPDALSQVFEQRIYKRVPPALINSSRSVVIERQVIHEPETFIQSDADAVK